MNHLTPRARFVSGALALFILGIALFYLPVSRAERSADARSMKTESPQEPEEVGLHSAPQAATVTNGKIVFQKGANGNSDIYTITPGSGVSVGLRKGYHPVYSPDATRIAFVDNSGTTNGQIMTMNADGTNARALVHPTVGFSPSWSPDGLRLAFVRGNFFSTGDTGSGEMFVMDMTPGNEGANEVFIPGTKNASKPSWGGNNRIVYQCRQQNPPPNSNPLLGICVTGAIPATAQIASNPPTISQISNGNLNDRDAAWSFDATQIAFLSVRDYPQFNASEIYVMDAQGSNVRRLTTDATAFKTGPAWAPDGTQIVFSKNGNQGSSNANLRIVKADGSDGSNPQILTNFGSGDAFPNWGVGASSAGVADLSLESLIDDPDPVTEGSNYNYVLTIKNTGPASATGLKVVTDPLPQKVRVHPIMPCTTAADRRATCTVNGTLASGATIQSALIFVGLEAGSATVKFTVSANETDPVPSNNFKSATTTIGTVADVGIEFSPSRPPSSVFQGDTMALSLVVKNHGPGRAHGVVFNGFVDPKFNNVVVTNGIGCSVLGNAVTCNMEALDSGDTRGIRITARANQTGTAENRMFIKVDINGTSDPNNTNNGDTATTTINAPQTDLGISGSVSQTAVFEGQTFSYTISVKNNGPSAATGVRVTDPFPSTISPVSSSDSRCTINSSTTVICNFGNLGKDASIGPVTITARAEQLTNSATTKPIVTGNETDPEAGNNEVSLAIRINPKPSLELIGLEVTQGIQNLANLIPLVAERSTFVRAHVKALNPNSAGVKVSAFLTVKNATTGAGLGTITNTNAGVTIKVLQLDNPLSPGPSRANLDDSFYFKLPADWTKAGPIEITFGGNEFPFTCNEGDGDNNCKTTVQFQTRRKFSIKFVSTTFVDSAGNKFAPTADDVVQAMTEIRANFPIADFE